MSSFFPYVRCLHPIKIKTRVGSSLVVPCGHCEACYNSKDYQNTLQCRLESQCHRYTYFVTLTYSNEYVPVAQVFDIDNVHYLVDMTYRPSNYNTFHKEYLQSGVILSSCYQTPDTIKTIKKIQDKTKLGGFIPYLYKKDCQDFVKRLRKQANEKYKEQIRYYAVGEYGPKTFRPHYHFLLWFESEELAQNLEQIISSCWRFGRVDVQSSLGDAAAYVAGYVNSNQYLPVLYDEKSTRPFRLHSNFLGAKFLQSKKKEVYEMSFKNFNTQCLPIGTKYKTFAPWRSLTSYFFPKCRRFNEVPTHVRYAIYSCYLRISHERGISKLSEQAEYLAKKFFKETDERAYSETEKLIITLCDSNYYINVSPKQPDYDKASDYLRLFDSIYDVLRTSKHFLFNVCDNTTYEERFRKINIIEDYYKFVESESLTKMLQYQQESSFEHEEDFRSYYINYYDEKLYKNDPVFKDFYNFNKRLSHDRIKHKKLNDANEFFFMDNDSFKLNKFDVWQI